MITINVPKSQITIDEEKNVMTVSSPELASQIQSDERVLKEMAKELGITTKDISISEDGKIQIVDKPFFDKALRDLGVSFLPLTLLCQKVNLCNIPLIICHLQEKYCQRPGIPDDIIIPIGKDRIIEKEITKL